MAKKIKTTESEYNDRKKYKVSGNVYNANAEPIMGQEVLAVDVDLRGAAIYKTAATVKELQASKGFDFLGITKTNIDGYYEVTFTEEMYKRNEIGLADVVVFAVDNGKITGRSNLASKKDYTKNEILQLDIQLPDASKRGVSEYARLMNVLEPFVKENEMQLFQLSASADQVSFLATETNQDPGNTNLAVLADKLRNDCIQQNKTVKSTFIIKEIGFSGELFYGIGRQNIPLSWTSLLAENATDLRTAVESSISQNIIAPQDDILIEAFIAIVLHVAPEYSATAPENSGIFKTVGFALTDAALQKTFVQSYMQFSGKPQDFWKNLSQVKGFTPGIVQSLQLTNQLSVLTAQNTPLIEELQVNRGIKNPSDLLMLSNDDWNKIVTSTGIPSTVTGSTPGEKTSNYITGIQNLLNAAYPTQKINLMIGSNQLYFKDANVKEKVSAFFASVQNFDISSSRITDFNSTIKTVAGNSHDQVVQQLQLMQRIYQVSPTPDVMNTLLSKGYTSASHITSISQNTFINMEADDLGGADIAFSVYNRASQQVMRAKHTLLKVRDTLDSATPSKVISPAQQDAARIYLKSLSAANWSNNFGSPADCECDDCSSIFSPASYMVDIMQYLDNCTPNAQGLSPLQVMLERRPDIGNLLLTCENTNTEIPYIDLVNEIMEYYVVYANGNNTAGKVIISNVHAGTSDSNVSALIVNAGAPTVTGNVTNGSITVSLTVASSTISNVNFIAGNIIIINGEEYEITSAPTGINTSTITFNLDRSYDGDTNPALPAASIQIYQPSGDTGAASAEELKAEPQNLLIDAYSTIYENAVYPFNLPYHQPLDVIRTYLNFLKTSRAQLMEVLPINVNIDTTTTPATITSASISPGAVDAENMQLSLREYEILTNSDFSGNNILVEPNVEAYFGSPVPQYTGNGIPVNDLLKRTGLLYTDLLAIMETEFINPGQNALNVLQNMLANASGIQAGDLYNALKTDFQNLTANINSPLTATTNTLLTNNAITSTDDVNNFKNWLLNNFTSFQQTITLYDSTSDCDIDNTYLHSIQCLYETPPSDSISAPAPDTNITVDFLSKLHRFIRLWRKTGWTVHELDNIISALGERDITTGEIDITGSLIHKFTVANKVNAILNLPILQLACFWGNIDTYGDNSLNVPAKSLYAQLFLKDTGNVTRKGNLLESVFAPKPLNEILSSSELPQLADHLPEIFAALSISPDDYNAIIANTALTDTTVSLKNLSLLYRYKLLADSLNNAIDGLNISVQDVCTLENIFNPAFDAMIQGVNAGTSGTARATLIVDIGTATITGQVTNGSAQISLTVSPTSKVTDVNFNAGDVIILNNVEYFIDSLPTGINSSTITFNVERNYTGATSAALPASFIQFYQPSLSDFILKVQKLQDSGFSVTVLDYIVNGTFKSIDNIALPQDQTLLALSGLHTALLTIDSDNPQTDIDNITTGLLLQKLMLLYSKDIANQFVLMLESSVPAVSSVTVPDQSYQITDATKYAYNITLVYTSLTGTFLLNETITDSNGSTAVVLNIADTKLTLANVTLTPSNMTLEGSIKGATSAATAVVSSLTILFELTGYMTDDEYSKISAGAGLSAGFKTAVDTLYQQSLTLLNNGFILTAPQVISTTPQLPATVFSIPATLSPKYIYSQNGNSWFLQCNGIMSDNEHTQLSSSGNTTFQSAVDYIYNYPSDFLQNNFIGFYNNAGAISGALQNLFGLAGAPLNDLTRKLQYFYEALLPFLLSELKQKEIISSVSSLVNLDANSVSAVIGSDISTLMAAASATGVTGYYSNTPPLATDPAVIPNANFSLPDPLPALSAAFTVKWKGWLCPPTDGDYLFSTILTGAGDTANLQINGAQIVMNTPTTLVGGQMYEIEVDYTHASGNAGVQVYWQSSNMAQAIIDTQYLYPDANIQALLQKALLYHRAAQFINGFNLKAAEVEYFTDNQPDFDNINFLPVSNAQWLRIYDYATLRKTIPANLLLAVFQQASIDYNANPAALPSDNLISVIANANKPGWNKDYLSYLTGNTGNASASPAVPQSKSYFNYNAGDFKNEIALLRVKKVMDLVIKTKMPVDTLPVWTKSETNPVTDDNFNSLHDIAEQIKNAVKGKYKDNWLTLATQLNNEIRENQKQALISYLLTLQLPAPDGRGSDGSGFVTDADTLFEFLLIDVQMTSIVVTSRLIQATLAVQLFADRCLLGLEAEVPLSLKAINPDEWDWMKHYSIEAGLKKLFVYVENYLDPSLRDDKSPFFLDFESAIKKNDITVENVENAFHDYLNKLTEVSNMEVCGMYNDTDTLTLHVFARTHAAPYNYYYRTASVLGKAESDDTWAWAPWEQVQLDIKSIDDGDNSGVHLVPVVWKKRLFLFWPEFMEKPVDSQNTNTTNYTSMAGTTPAANAPQKYWEVRLAWSEYANSKWTPKKLSKEVLNTLYTTSGNIAPTLPRQYFLRSVINPDDSLTINLYIRFSGQLSNDAVELGNFHLTNSHENIVTNDNYYHLILGGGKVSDTAKSTKNKKVAIKSETEGAEVDALYNNNETIFDVKSGFYDSFFESLTENNELEIATNSILQKNPINHRILFSNDVTIPNFEGSVTYPFFLTDISNNREYFATPVQISELLFTGGIDAGVEPLLSAANAPLMMLNTLAVAAPVIQNVQPQPGSLAPDEEDTISVATLPAFGSIAPPAINNFSNPGQIIAKVSKKNMQDVGIDAESFFGNGIIKSHGPIYVLNNGVAFYSFYHPFTATFIKLLNQKDGISKMLAANTAEFAEDPNHPDIGSNPAIAANDQGNTFHDAYNPNIDYVKLFDPINPDPDRNYYLQNVDFSEYGTYSCYNWELFFHAPLLIATSLSKNGKYADARTWFHYIFNPLSTEAPDPNNANSPFWRVLPFKKPQTEIDVVNSNADIDNWRADPFNAFKIARSRPVTFMKNVVMSYLDNLINWGDDLFRTYTRENINEATQLYVMAAHILGPKPQYIPERGTIQSKSYNDLKTQLDDFGDAVVELENAFPNSSGGQQMDNSVPQNLLGVGGPLYFCVPPNDNLLQYWTKVGDRLFKIRHGQNIDGVVVPLALYEPPIDPALLLQAKAQGLDIAGILADLESPAPMYRFNYLSQKAKEFCNEVVSLGSSILSASEKQDAEQLGRMRQLQEIDMLNRVTDVKSRQVLEAQANLDNLNSSRNTAIQKLSHYAEQLLGNQPTQVPAPPTLSDNLDENSSLPPETLINQVTSAIDVTLSGTDESGVKIIPKEKEEMDYSELSTTSLLKANSAEMLAGILRLIPQFDIDIKPIGVGAGTGFGGVQLGAVAELAAKALHSDSELNSYYSSSASRMAGFIRREQDWVFQSNMAIREIVQLDKQIIAGQIRLQMAQHELANHRQQIQNANDIEQFLETKFSKQELYQWMLDKLQDAHKQGYQLAYDMARKAEEAYRFELGLQESNFVQYGYYNDSYLGITAGEQLQLALKQMDASYIENNIREFELTKHISLIQLDPLALIQLKETGQCTIDLPEQIFDIDYPGHYFRRIKSVSISIPCVAGPYTTINSTLRLTKNSIRIDTISDNDFVENNIPFTAIATSSAQNDSGMFELNYRDERYLPFEGAGVISSWLLELNGKYQNNDGTVTDISQFDYETISDIIVQIRYTSREGEGEFRTTVISKLQKFLSGSDEPFMRLFSFRHEFPTEWYNFLNQKDSFGNQVLQFNINGNRFPFFASNKAINIVKAQILSVPGNSDNDLETNGIYLLTQDKIPPIQNPPIDPTINNTALPLSVSDAGLPEATFTISNGSLGNYLVVNKNGNAALGTDNIKDLFLILYYQLKA